MLLKHCIQFNKYAFSSMSSMSRYISTGHIVIVLGVFFMVITPTFLDPGPTFDDFSKAFDSTVILSPMMDRAIIITTMFIYVTICNLSLQNLLDIQYLNSSRCWCRRNYSVHGFEN